MAVLPTGIGPVTGYNIERSLRFNSADTAYLSRTPASASNRTTWTWSGWIKRSSLGYGNFFAASNGSNIQFYAAFNSNDTIGLVDYTGTININLNTTQVFRDVGAWAHFVISMDTTQATASNRLKFYVNGSQVTVFSTATYPTQNYNTAINSTVLHSIGREEFADLYYLNGYMTEVNFIDGQALTPSSFGETDANTGVWKPKAYTGTYGTNGFYLPFKTASQWSGYFDGTADYLSVPHNSSLSPTGDFTIEFWAYTGSTAVQEWVTKGYGIQIYSNSSSWFVALSSANNTTYFISGSFGTLSTNTWQHIAISRQGNTYRGFVNGVATTLGTSSSAPSTGTDSLFVGAMGVGTPYYATGYLSNLRIVNGTAVYTGTFTPPTSQLTAITNTSLLTCQSSTFVDNSTNAFTITASGDARPQQFSPFTLDVTDDHSGTGNNWQPNNLDLRTTGAGADILVDSPTSYGTDTGAGGEVRGNYATLNPLDNYLNTLSDGNLKVVISGLYATRATISVSSGKWYWEATNLGGTNNALMIGISDATVPIASSTWQGANGWYYYGFNGNKYTSNASAAYGAAYTTNDVVGVALDCDAGTLTFYKNGVSQGVAYTGLGGKTLSANIGSGGATQNAVINFGQRPFAYTAPSGFKALCTQNLPPVDVGATSTTQAGKYFNAVTYTGNGTDGRTVTGVGFNPDLVWVKGRSNAGANVLADAVRGSDKNLYTNLTDAETNPITGASGGGIGTVTTDGFVLEQGTVNMDLVNTSARTYVAWNWNAGGSNQTISVGQYSTSPNVPSIASTVRANTTSKFSIVTYTGNGTNGATVGHGLGTTPAMVIIKSRSLTGTTPSASWIVWHRSISQAIQTDTTIALTGFTGATVLNSTAQSTTYGFDAQVNGSTQTYVAYCFAPVAGYSAFGSYTGNGDPNGPFVYTGFRPRYILVKRTDSADNWAVYDTARDSYNQSSKQLRPDATTNELDPAGSPAVYYDLLSNGFKNRGSNSQCNANGGTYIYACFAENPFKYSLAR